MIKILENMNESYSIGDIQKIAKSCLNVENRDDIHKLLTTIYNINKKLYYKVLNVFKDEELSVQSIGKEISDMLINYIEDIKE